MRLRFAWMLAYKPFFGILCSFAPLDALIISCAVRRKHLPRVFQPARYGLYALALALHHGAAKRKTTTLDAAKQKQRRPHYLYAPLRFFAIHVPARLHAAGVGQPLHGLNFGAFIKTISINYAQRNILSKIRLYRAGSCVSRHAKTSSGLTMPSLHQTP